ncbi:SWI/SNF-related matrix-associated actin-dependent regulator of chromatin subfamily A-like protein 1 [Asterias amurensis]|uniref:SWI/SNF-related matrix-associated actin-dependent regulator of chromatin subfamily A-like protein 1 n=1 Tax=Asterias amurensis TaxID=7602 RepID=UPI003AB10B04
MATTGGLTEEQKRRMEENKKRAILLRAQRNQGNNQGVKQVGNSSSNVRQEVGTSSKYGNTQQHVTTGKKSNVDRPSGSSSTSIDSAKKWTSIITKPSTLQTSAIASSSKVVGVHQTGGAAKEKSILDTAHGTHCKSTVSNSSSTTQGHVIGGHGESSSNSSNSLNRQKTISSFYSTKPKSASGGQASLSGQLLKGNAHSSSHKSGFQAFNDPPKAFSKRPDVYQNIKGNKSTFGNERGMNLQGSSGGNTVGVCVLISRERFVVNVGYHAKLIEVFKELPSKSYDAVEKKWSFALSEYDTLIEAVKPLQPSVEIEPLPKTICTAFRRQRHGKEGNRVIPEANLKCVDSTLVNALMGFQREGVNFAISREGRVLIADEMGLGKTLQAICVACYYRAEWPVLVVSPSSVRYSWAEAFQTWIPSLSPDDINVVVNSKHNATSGKVNILSYDLMHRKAQELKQYRFKVIIMDESHFLKNIKTARTKAAIPLMKTAPRVILLSGTPALSRPSELYTQILGVTPRLFPSFHEFGLRYCNATRNQWGWDYSGSSNMTELQLLLEECIMIRRLKQDVMTELPSKTRQMVLMDPSVVKTNSKALKNAADEMGKNKSKSDDRGLLMKYFAETALVKVPAIRDYVLDLLEGGHKFLVFAHHQTVLDALSTALTNKKYDFIRIDGSTSALQRKANCDKFQQEDSCRAAILSITAANAGLTLTSASTVVFAELFWNPGILVQAEDRVHRIGQQDSVNIKYLIAKGTADDYIWPLVQKKLSVLGQAGLSKDDFSEADTTAFKDPRQKTLLSFFETSFLEDNVSEQEDLACLVAMESQESENKVYSATISATEELTETIDSRVSDLKGGSDNRNSANSTKKKNQEEMSATEKLTSKQEVNIKTSSIPSVVPLMKSKTLFSTPWASKKPLTEPNIDEGAAEKGPPAKRQKNIHSR